MLRQYILLESLLRTRREDLRNRRGERGATAVEYGLMVGLIAVVIIVAVTLLGKQLDALFDKITGGLAGTSGVSS
jgi:pilus assembly protein Flp/PilA